MKIPLISMSRICSSTPILLIFIISSFIVYTHGRDWTDINDSDLFLEDDVGSGMIFEDGIGVDDEDDSLTLGHSPTPTIKSPPLNITTNIPISSSPEIQQNSSKIREYIKPADPGVQRNLTTNQENEEFSKSTIWFDSQLGIVTISICVVAAGLICLIVVCYVVRKNESLYISVRHA